MNAKSLNNDIIHKLDKYSSIKDWNYIICKYIGIKSADCPAVSGMVVNSRNKMPAELAAYKNSGF
ncbi:hypothetical protein [Dyadobacter sediminis]|uniref:hypothetical protein n=1 Tax=Dyadobacter sediminis TaxID=1493691 RepID=UPI0014867A5A|nr:hypothetical protein [Dyadobacter sediminis]GGB84075.1 hypothetical protein GCM10011325_09580 [Dyadobacter sediminis]